MLNKNQAMEDAAQMEELRKWRESQQPAEYADEEPLNYVSAVIVVLVMLAICLVAFSPEIAAVLYTHTK